MTLLTKDQVRELAYERMRETPVGVRRTAIATLEGFGWKIPQGLAASQQQVAEWNESLHLSSCLGRIARALAITESYFPHLPLMCGEVVQDMLAALLLNLVRGENDNEERVSMLREVLQYEEPHAVVVIGGEQFDPISVVLKARVTHLVVEFEPWDALYSAWLVSAAYRESDLDKRFDISDLAEKACTGSMLAAESRVGALLLLGDEPAAIKQLISCMDTRPTARTLYTLWLLTRNEYYKRRIEETYAPQMFTLLQETGGR